MENELDTLDCESAANELDGSEEIALETSSEIIQSVLQSAKAQEHSLKEHGNLTYLRSYWLHEGKFSRKIAQAMIVRSTGMIVIEAHISLCNSGNARSSRNRLKENKIFSLVWRKRESF